MESVLYGLYSPYPQECLLHTTLTGLTCFIYNITYMCVYLFSLDKSPLLMDFVAQIKANADTAQIFESIQADATITITMTGPGPGVEMMELS